MYLTKLLSVLLTAWLDNFEADNLAPQNHNKVYLKKIEYLQTITN